MAVETQTASAAMVASVAQRLSPSGLKDATRHAERLVAAAQADPETIERLVARHVAGEPLDLILGRGVFMGLELVLPAGVLAPRAETELLATVALAAMYPLRGARPRIVDVCCGAGNLAITLAYNLPSAMVWATDLLERAALATRDNAHLHRLTDRVTAVCGDLFAPLADAALEGAVDLVVCNPPYLSTKRLESEREGLLKHEPREAFDAGPYGLSMHQRLIGSAVQLLTAGGWLLFEFGVGQDRQVTALIKRSGQYVDVRTVCDPSGVARVAVARRKA